MSSVWFLCVVPLCGSSVSVWFFCVGSSVSVSFLCPLLPSPHDPFIGFEGATDGDDPDASIERSPVKTVTI